MFLRILLVATLVGSAFGDAGVSVVRKKQGAEANEAVVVDVKRHGATEQVQEAAEEEAVDLKSDSSVVRHRATQTVTVGDEGSTIISSGEDEEVEDAELAEDLAILESILEESKTWDVEEEEGSSPSSLAEMKSSDMCGCFPGSAEVRLEDGTFKRVSTLEQGDMVQTFLEDGSVSYSPFVLDFHAANTMKAEFVEISTDAGKPLRATANHLVYTSSGSFVRAAEVKVGDELLSFGAESEVGTAAKVLDVRMVQDEAIYSPLTDTGRLVVEGYAVSSYSLRSGEVAAMRAALGEKVDVHQVSHAMELPVLAFYRSGIPQMASSICSTLLGSSWCSMGPSPTDVAWTWNIRIISDGLVPTLKQIL